MKLTAAEEIEAQIESQGLHMDEAGNGAGDFIDFVYSDLRIGPWCPSLAEVRNGNLRLVIARVKERSQEAATLAAGLRLTMHEGHLILVDHSGWPSPGVPGATESQQDEVLRQLCRDYLFSAASRARAKYFKRLHSKEEPLKAGSPDLHT